MKLIQQIILTSLVSACASHPATSATKDAEAAPAVSSTTYYSGTAITTLPAQQAGADPMVFSAPYLDERTVDQTAGTITERVISRGQDGKFKVNTAVMTMSGNDFTMAESTHTVLGGGTFTGKAWKWTYMKGEFTTTFQGATYKIHDVNFFAAANLILGHKDIESPTGAIVSQEDVTLPVVTPAEFALQEAQLLGTKN